MIYYAKSYERCKDSASRPSQGTVNGGAVSKWPCCPWDIKHNQPTLLVLRLYQNVKSIKQVVFKLLRLQAIVDRQTDGWPDRHNTSHLSTDV